MSEVAKQTLDDQISNEVEQLQRNLYAQAINALTKAKAALDTRERNHVGACIWCLKFDDEHSEDCFQQIALSAINAVLNK